MIKGAIFDVDGVLLDSMCIWLDAGERYLKSMGIEAEPDLSEIMWSMSISEGAAYLKKQYGLQMTEQEIMQGVLGTVRDFYYEEAAPKAGVREFLKALSERGIPMVLATTGEKTYVKRAFERLGIEVYFRGIVTPVEAGAGKTDPAIYRMAAELVGTAPEETYVFEDVIHAIRTANAAGFRTVGVYDSSSEKDQEAIRTESDIYVKDLTDFEAFWEKAVCRHGMTGRGFAFKGGKK